MGWDPRLKNLSAPYHTFLFFFCCIEQLLEQIGDLLSHAHFSFDLRRFKTIQWNPASLIKKKYIFDFFFGFYNFLNRFWICHHEGSLNPIHAVPTAVSVVQQTWLFENIFMFFDNTTFLTHFGFALTGAVFNRSAPFKDHSIQLNKPEFWKVFWFFGLNNSLKRFWICSPRRTSQPISGVQRPFNAAFKPDYWKMFLFSDRTTSFWRIFLISSLGGNSLPICAVHKDHSMQPREPDILQMSKFLDSTCFWPDFGIALTKRVFIQSDPRQSNTIQCSLKSHFFVVWVHLWIEQLFELIFDLLS